MSEEQMQMGDLGRLGKRLRKVTKRVGKVVKRVAPIVGAGAALYFGGAGAASLLASARRKRAAAAPAPAPEPAAAPSSGPSIVETMAQGAAAALPAIAQAAPAFIAARQPEPMPQQFMQPVGMQQRRNWAPITEGPDGPTATFDPVEVRGQRPGRQVPWLWIGLGAAAIGGVLLLSRRKG